jgi:hypothetical protein
LGKVMLTTTDGVAGCLMEFFQLPLRSEARDESTLAYMVKACYDQ